MVQKRPFGGHAPRGAVHAPLGGFGRFRGLSGYLHDAFCTVECLNTGGVCPLTEWFDHAQSQISEVCQDDLSVSEVHTFVVIWNS